MVVRSNKRSLLAFFVLAAWASTLLSPSRYAWIGRLGTVWPVGATCKSAGSPACGHLRQPSLPPRVALRAGEDEDGPADGPSPEAWRDFRAQLIAGGLKLTTDEESPDASADSGELASERKSVAPKNEELLRQQNEQLWNEYMSGGWAHVSPVEASGLMCRLPLQYQLMQLLRQGNESTSPAGEAFRKRMLAELPASEDSARSPEEMLETWSRNTNYCYRLAETVTKEMMARVLEIAPDGRVDPSKLDPADLDMLMLYGNSQESWQSVCLVLSAEGDVATEAVALNRPLGMDMNERLAGMILNGGDKDAAPAYSEELVKRCAEAFGEQCAVYLGGPLRQEEPGVLVHGYSQLRGAKEISPGSKIYRGGVEDAINGILKTEFNPLDFRWFVGRHVDLKSKQGEWLPIACSRPIALKQCLGLPKPLWHEVMELCGGEAADLSRLELLKRDDLEDN